MPPLPRPFRPRKLLPMALRDLFRLLAAAVLALALPAAAQDDSLAEALALPVASSLAGARDTPRFAWVETEAGVRNVWVADAGKPARRVTAYGEDDGVPLYHLALSRDGARLAYVRGGDDEFPDGAPLNAGSALVPPRQQVFVVETDGGQPIAAGEGHSPAFDTAGERLAFTRGGEIWVWQRGTATRLATLAGEVTRLQWSPDGSRLLFVDNRNDHSFVGLIDVAAGKLRYLDPGLGYSVEPTFSPDGTRVAFIRYLDPPQGAAAGAGPYWSLRVADAATGAARTLWSAPPGSGGRYAGTRMRNLHWSADGELVFPWEASGWLHAYAISADKGGTPRPLTSGAFEVETFLLAADGRSLVYAANAGDTLDRRHLWQQLLRGGAPVQLTRGQGIESFPTFAGTTLAALATDVDSPAHPVLAADLKPLRAAPTLAGAIAPEPVTYRAADGVEVHGQLFRGRGPGKRPALVFVHGGPRRQMLLGFHPMGYYSNAYLLNQRLAAAGYTVLSVNYRSGTGYGRAFRDAPETGREGAAEYRDVLAGGRWLAAQAHVDSRRIGIWGGSWGGYLTALALARDGDLFAAGVDFHGVHTMLRPLDNNLSPERQAAARQRQWDSSPMGAIDRWRSPVLLVHGDDDKSVGFGQSLLLARELAARRIPYRELVFPNDRHEFFRYANWLESYRATIAFLDETLKAKR
jgi:dipeptidyl aminopeptidase/acylaminoacyl peptidase